MTEYEIQGEREGTKQMRVFFFLFAFLFIIFAPSQYYVYNECAASDF